MLDTLFSRDDVQLVTKREETSAHARLSVLGCVVTDTFGDTFNADTIAGMYRRFLFADWPSNAAAHLHEDPNQFEPVWTPAPTPEAALYGGTDIARPVAVHLDRSVFE